MEIAPAIVAVIVAVSFALYYLIGAPGREIDSVPTGLATVFFGLGAITYARHPEGILEHNKRVSLARVQGWLDNWKARRGGPPSSEPALSASGAVASPVGASQ